MMKDICDERNRSVPDKGYIRKTAREGSGRCWRQLLESVRLVGRVGNSRERVRRCVEVYVRKYMQINVEFI